MYLDVIYTDGSCKEFPIKSKTLKGIEKQADNLYDDENVYKIQLVRYWNENKQGGLDSRIDVI